ncbi:hypothetical protein BT93_C0085 [Corymbia citriodora subsp. variegata]|nr:hypothetical protein BT93_C0085 [Corymbia citriodora subsp. variegata]
MDAPENGRNLKHQQLFKKHQTLHLTNTVNSLRIIHAPNTVLFHCPESKKENNVRPHQTLQTNCQDSSSPFPLTTAPPPKKRTNTHIKREGKIKEEGDGVPPLQAN